MKKNTKVLFSIILFCLSMILIVATNSESAEKKLISISIAAPKNRSEVGREVMVRGTASIPGGSHLWVLARRKDFKPLWWPQREAEVDPTTGEWDAVAILGGPQDVGWEFDIGVIVVSGKAHVKLREYWINAMKTGDWLPIEIPTTDAPPQIIKVIKKSH